jgi:hypothetical protein
LTGETTCQNYKGAQGSTSLGYFFFEPLPRPGQQLQLVTINQSKSNKDFTMFDWGKKTLCASNEALVEAVVDFGRNFVPGRLRGK